MSLVNDNPSEAGRRGGLKGGKARAAKLSAERRREIARKANAAKRRKPIEEDYEPTEEELAAMIAEQLPTMPEVGNDD